ncbi:chloride channel protein [Clostridium botulinum]|uniref:Chloride channel protein n=1 Tax=Clostridium botulinum TaxID=1491 RepID=A0A6B4JMX3_CLOBO|nr:chloride channel protein [Clostridium botulinum]EES48700.1 voltage gated chloride channel family [Clostridium botulinum E1 str. 'BoNT E Beluga']MBY6761564.1 chloride channel protein [Clostridium botulinum]MBY6920104.1 chloride channel protein [Clostridium botulinum]MCR1130993.1 chloride channel protein [Clostridium botulinum]NFJ58187.1 chloride channel protein [Clostridium botulinum]
MNIIIARFKSIKKYIITFFLWVVIAGITGLIGGFIGSLFHLSVEYATRFRIENDWIIFMLPLGGALIICLYKIFKLGSNIGTNLVIDSIRTDGKVPFSMSPLIFISTVITHLFGGSAGREGAALQLGGSIGSQVGKILHLDEKDMHLITLCGMSGVFSALFGTPLTATFFAMEVISVGIIYYSSFIPCIVSSIVAYKVSLLFGLEPVRFNINVIPNISTENIIKVAILGALCALVSIIFCETLHKTNKFLSNLIKNDYLRIICGGLAIVALTFIVGCRDYNGAGMDIIANAINGQAKPEAFILKIIFTAITISVGYKGGEIVPTFFIGATFGCVVGGLIGLDPRLGAAIGLVALFCGVVNTLITSVILSIELFGSSALILFAVACGVSYMLSGYFSLYSSQKIVYSKLKAEFINRDAE